MLACQEICTSANSRPLLRYANIFVQYEELRVTLIGVTAASPKRQVLCRLNLQMISGLGRSNTVHALWLPTMTRKSQSGKLQANRYADSRGTECCTRPWCL